MDAGKRWSRAWSPEHMSDRMLLGGHIRELLMLERPNVRENRALPREALRVFMTADAKPA